MSKCSLVALPFVLSGQPLFAHVRSLRCHWAPGTCFAYQQILCTQLGIPHVFQPRGTDCWHSQRSSIEGKNDRCSFTPALERSSLQSVNMLSS